MDFNMNIPRILVLVVTLNSCLILTKQLNATSFDSNQKNGSELITFSQEQFPKLPSYRLRNEILVLSNRWDLFPKHVFHSAYKE